MLCFNILHLYELLIHIFTDNQWLHQALLVINLWETNCLYEQYGAELCTQSQACFLEVVCNCSADIYCQEQNKIFTLLTKSHNNKYNDIPEPGQETTITMQYKTVFIEIFQTVLQIAYSNQLQCCVMMTVNSYFRTEIKVLAIAAIYHNGDCIVSAFCLYPLLLPKSTVYSDSVLHEPHFCKKMAVQHATFSDHTSSNCYETTLLVSLNVMDRLYYVSTTCQAEEGLSSKLSNSSFVSSQPSECIESGWEYLCLLPIAVQCSSLNTTPFDSDDSANYDECNSADDNLHFQQSFPDNNGNTYLLLESVTPKTECSQQEVLIVYPTTIGCYSNHTISFPMQGHCSGHPLNDYQVLPFGHNFKQNRKANTSSIMPAS